MQQVTLFVLSLAMVQLISACYITNCPIGGKRSLLFNNGLRHQCPTCGNNGQCYGPSICCTSRGCRIGHPTDIRQCSSENRSIIPCSIKSTTCAVVSNGRCAANGVCCGSESCQMDDNCSTSSSGDVLNFQEF